MTEPKVFINSLSSGAIPDVPLKTAAQQDGSPAVETSWPFMGPGGMSTSPGHLIAGLWSRLQLETWAVVCPGRMPSQCRKEQQP